MTKRSLVLGIMSGTSIDSIDYAICEVTADAVRLKEYWQVPFPKALQEGLHRAARGEGTSHELARLHHELGRCYAKGAEAGGVGGGRRGGIELVGLHGQTVFHSPEGRERATFQLGEPAYLAERLGVPVVSNFRVADLAAGGQGAPLATLFHWKVFGERGRHVCVNNLGGISNVTSVDWRGLEPRIVAFDTGPANVLMDLAVRHFSEGRRGFDRGGTWASRGRCDEVILTEWLGHWFFKKAPPKSTGRELFGEAFFGPSLSLLLGRGCTAVDCVATFTELTARSIALNYRWHLPGRPDKVLLTGGGAANPVLVGWIGRALGVFWRGLEVRTSAELGWPDQSIEPAAFALLAYYRARAKPGNIPEATGARHPAVLGQVSLPPVVRRRAVRS